MEFGIHRKTITVVSVDEYSIEFNEAWAIEGDLLQDYNDINHTITIDKSVHPDDKKFTYVGTAKIGELYYVKFQVDD